MWSDGPHRVEELVTEEVPDAVCQFLAWCESIEFASVNRERETDAWMRESVDGEDCLHVVLFGDVGTEELAASRDIAEKIADFDEGSDRTAGGTDLGEGAGGDLEEGSLVRIGTAGGDGEAGDGCYRRNRFPAESEGVDLLDVLDVEDLGCGLTFKGEHGIVFGHATAVVLYGHELASALRDGDIDLLRAGVNSVFDELIEDDRWTFYNFDCRELV